MLEGSEVKSMREGGVNIAESYANIEDGELWLINSHIPKYEQAKTFQHEERRKRKLLVSKKERSKLWAEVGRQGMTLVPLKVSKNKTNAPATKNKTGNANNQDCCAIGGRHVGFRKKEPHMPFLPSLPETAHLSDLFSQFPRGVQPLMEYTDAVLRDAGELSIAERELIATYTSALNACTFCYGAHKIYAEAFGISEAMIEGLVADLDTVAGIDKLKPILRYVQKLNTLPAKIVQADAQAVYDAGWSEHALYEATQVCALFNMMNRIIEGAGVNFDYASNPEVHSMNRDAADVAGHTYGAYGKRISDS